MALSCDAFGGTGNSAQTVGTTQQNLACKRECETLSEVDEPEFYALVVDALDRLGVKLSVTGARVENVTPEEAQQAVENARLALCNRTITSFTPRNAKAVILAQLSELICA